MPFLTIEIHHLESRQCEVYVLRLAARRLQLWRARERAVVVTAWLAMRLVPARRHVAVHGWPDSEGNAVETVRALAARYPGTVYWLRDRDWAGEDPAPVGTPPGRVVSLRVNTVAALRVLFRAEATFFTHGMMTAVKPSRSRLVVNLWHGDGPKLTPHLPPQCSSTVVVAATELWGSYKAELFGLRREDVAVVGNPRVDSMLLSTPAATRERLGLARGGQRLVLWLPTYRHGTNGRHPVWEEGHLLSETVRDRIVVPDGVQLVVKPHPMDTDDHAGTGATVLGNDDLAAAGVTLLQLMGAADALVSDASSAWVDHLSTGRPIGFFLPDLDSFGEMRGYNVPDLRAVLPGPVLPDAAAVSRFLVDVRDGNAQPPAAHPDAMARIGYSAQLPVTEHLFAWLDDYQRARGRRPLFAVRSTSATGGTDGTDGTGSVSG